MTSFDIKSPLFWVGAKRWQLPQMREWFRPDMRWVEPFCGGASLAFGLEPRRAHLNDINPHLMNFYRWLQKDGVFFTDPPVLDTKDAYYQLRRTFNAAPTAESNADALRFYLLNQMGHKGMWRVNRAGQLNTAYGYRADTDGVEYVKMPNVPIYRHIMAEWTLSCGSYTSITLTSNDFLYVDPPYDTEFAHYDASGFSWREQELVATWAGAHSGPVVLCNQATSRIVELYRDLQFTIIPVQRIERMRSGEQGTAQEILAIRNITESSLF